MRSGLAKHLHPLLGRRMVDWVVAAATPLAPDPLVVVASPGDRRRVRRRRGRDPGAPARHGRRGARGAQALGDADAVLVLSGDTPLLTTECLTELLRVHGEADAAATVLSFVPDDPRSYGRVVRGEDGGVVAIVEAADATPEQLAIERGELLDLRVPRRRALARARAADGAQRPGRAVPHRRCAGVADGGATVGVYVAPDPAETEGVNTRVELAAATAVLRDRINEAHMLAGVTIVDPETTWIEPTVTLEADASCTRSACCVARRRRGRRRDRPPRRRGGRGDRAGALVGPFCYLRPGTVLGASSKAGTFVELKNTSLGEGTKVPHLSYMGDAEIGDRTNVGAGTITVNLPHGGGPKQRTEIGRDVRVGVDTVLVAPVTLGDDAWTAAGTVVTDDVPENALVGFPPRQDVKEGRGGRRDG